MLLISQWLLGPTCCLSRTPLTFQSGFSGWMQQLRKAPATGDGSEIFDLAWDAFLALPDEPATDARAMCLLGIARNRYLRGLPFDGIEPANHAVAVAERLKNDLVLAKCLKMLGVMYMETGNFPAAMTALTRALPAARNAGDPEQESGIFNNLGLPTNTRASSAWRFRATNGRSRSPIRQRHPG